MSAMMRARHMAMPLVKLKKLQSDLELLLRELEAGPRREVDIAWEHRGVPAQICEVLEVRHVDKGKRWKQLEKIYCSAARCLKCPHGPYWYEYRTNKRRETVTVVFKGKMAFDYDLIRELKRNTRPGKPYVFETVAEDRTK